MYLSVFPEHKLDQISMSDAPVLSSAPSAPGVYGEVWCGWPGVPSTSYD